MKTEAQALFTLENFEGPIDFLLHLIQQNEIPIQEIALHNVTAQFLAIYNSQKYPLIETGAEFIGIAAFLLWFKSKTLLPQHVQTDCSEENESDLKFTIIHQLLDYCKFKEIAKNLEEREDKQKSYYLRGLESSEVKKNLGIEHLSLDDLSHLFKQLLSKAPSKKGIIVEEEWQVSDKIEALIQLLEATSKLSFDEVFTELMSRLELIVTFLALLELMKRGTLRVGKIQEKVFILNDQ